MNDQVLPNTSNISPERHDNYATTLKLPPFWTSKPDVWFTQVEAQFNVARITNDRKKYDHILATLPVEIINNIYDIIQNPQEQNLYNHLKETIISRLSSSEEKRLEDLLTGSQMGNRKPSEFYRNMLGIVGGSHMVSQELLLKLWKRRLPKTIFVAITASGKTNAEDLIDIADKIWESCQDPILSQVSQHSNSSPNQPTTSKIDSSLTLSTLFDKFNNLSVNLQSTLNQVLLKQQSLEMELATVKSNNLPNQSTPFSLNNCYPSCKNRSRSHSQNRSNSRSNSRSRSRFDPTNNSICYYHQLYKENAFKCGGPWCTFNKNQAHNTNLTPANHLHSKN